MRDINYVVYSYNNTIHITIGYILLFNNFIVDVNISNGNIKLIRNKVKK